MQPTKLFYIWLSFMLGNTTIFLSSLFLFNYTESTGHWSQGAWEAITVISGSVKAILWMAGAAGVVDKKFFKEYKDENP